MLAERWQKIEELFNAAMECGPRERAALLDANCGGDPNLRAEVELLLANEARAGSFLESPATDVPGGGEPSLIGRTFGSYTVVSLLGAGGMGEVYRAHDAKLGRDVALKTLPVEFARDPERLGRLRREARTLASLNHPNIAAIYDVEESDDADSLVLELVEGESPAGPLPLARALAYARQIADALEAAHARGIVHRDLKPANVKVTPEGRVKVLDFGLAKALEAPELARIPATAPAGRSFHTIVGRVMGTPSYMSPEQARGAQVDKRSDIWAFGCLLYELLSGRRAFPGESSPDAIAAVLAREPDWRALPSKTPASIARLLRHCLQKDPEQRLADIGEARKVIEKAQSGRNVWAMAAAAAAIVAIGSAAVLWMRPTIRPTDSSRWTQLTRFNDSVTQPALSPDGRKVAFVRGSSSFLGSGQIYVKTLPDGDSVQLTRDSLVKTMPAFSPDGGTIAYTTYLNEGFSWDTWTVPVSGGEPRLWLKNASGLIWNGPGQLLFSEIKMGVHMGIVASDEKRSRSRNVFLPSGEACMAHRSFPSPDGKSVLLSEMDDDHLWLPCRLVPMDGSSAGHPVGPAGGGCTFAAWSPDGKWMYFVSNAVGANHIWRQRFPDGKPEQITSGPTAEEGIAMAPDGRSLITAVSLNSTSLRIHDSQGDRDLALEGNAAEPEFTPDGARLCYREAREPPSEMGFYRDAGEIRVVDLQSGRTEALAPGFRALEYDISPEGRDVVMEVPDENGRSRLFLAPLDRSAPPRQIPNVGGSAPRFDGKGDILFRRTEGSRSERTVGTVFRVHRDGSGWMKAFEQPVLLVGSISPDRRWLDVWAPLPGNGPPASQVIPLDGGKPVIVGTDLFFAWAPDGSAAAMRTDFGDVLSPTRAYVVPLTPGQAIPKIPAGGFHSEKEISSLPGAQRVDDVNGIWPGKGQGVYAFYRGAVQRNLYRIPLP